MCNKTIQLDLFDHATKNGSSYQHLHISFNSPSNRLEPDNIKELILPASIDSERGIVLEGRVPNWVYGYLTDKCYSAAWIGCYGPRFSGAIIVQSKYTTPTVGEVVNIDLPIQVQSRQHRSTQTGAKMTRRLELQYEDVISELGEVHQCITIYAQSIQPSDLQDLKLPETLDLNRGVVLWGEAPIWCYSHLVFSCREAPWVGCFNVNNGVVIVTSRDKSKVPGDCFRLQETKPGDKPVSLPCPAILIGGPPNSGKSVLCRALDQALQEKGLKNKSNLYRAQWDGEGDWYIDMYDRGLAQDLREQVKGKPTDVGSFYKSNESAINENRRSMLLVLVDFGGKPQPSDADLLRSCCTHYIIISNNEEEIPKWHDFCCKLGKLKPLAVIHSILDDHTEILRKEPYLEIKAGPWDRNKTTSVPAVLLEHVMALISPDADDKQIT